MVKKSTANQSPVLEELKSAAGRSIIAIAAVIGAAVAFTAIVIVVTLYGLSSSLSPNCDPDDKKLQRTNAAQKKSLDSTTILNGQHANSEVHRDCSSNEVYALAEFPTSTIANQALTEVRRNVESQGFKREGLVSVSQGTNNDDVFVVNDLHEKYSRSNKTEELQIDYTFTKDYPCDEIKQLCGYSDFEPVDLLLQAPLKSVTTSYYIHKN